VLYCTIATEEDLRGVVEMFGEKKQVSCELSGVMSSRNNI